MTVICNHCGSATHLSRQFDRVTKGETIPVSVYTCPICGWSQMIAGDEPDRNAGKVNRHDLYFPDPDDPPRKG